MEKFVKLEKTKTKKLALRGQNCDTSTTPVSSGYTPTAAEVGGGEGGYCRHCLLDSASLELRFQAPGGQALYLELRGPSPVLCAY